MKSFVYFKGATGLNNLVDPVRIQRDDASAVGDLARAFNVDIDNSGRVSRRKGYKETPIRVKAHSMFAEKEYCLFVSGDSLFRVTESYETIGLRSGMTIGASMDYAYINNSVYYVNGFEIGYVKDSLSYVWKKGDEFFGEPTFEQMSNPPIGHLVCYHEGRMYIAQDNVLWFSAPFSFGAFDLARNYYQFSSRIVGVKAVKGGLYVSDMSGIYFISTKTDARFDTTKVSNEQDRVYEWPMIEGSAVVGDGTSLQIEGMIGKVMVCATEKGICIGDSDGKFYNMTINKVVYPKASKASATILDGCYLCLLQE